MNEVERFSRDRRRGLIAALSLVGLSIAGVGAGIGVCCRATPAAAAVTQGTGGAGGGIQEGRDAVVTIEIPEVDCASCDLEVRKAIKGAGGVRHVEGATPRNRLVVTYEPGSGRPDAYVQALHKAGFGRAHVVG